MTEIRHIVFDIGKVLIHYDPNLPYQRIIPDPDERAKFFATVCTHDWNIEQDRGRSWAEAEALLIGEFPEHEDKIRAFRLHWAEMVPHAYEDSVAIMTSLIASGHDVTMLTNFAADTFGEARKMYPFLNAPRGVTVSGEVGLIKPDVAIYQRHAKDFDLSPAHSVFIDDSFPNVEGARAAGWQAVHFTGADQLKADLLALGVGV
ncbi:HAD family hydrolase [Rhizobium wuzhouense]|uniref:2-haloalkanoic acid dehalogenase n=1 Tax=Rhizobium wuzhouense TaxID=1986026 RepID=A0ABX5NVD9_9HYPH|nr:HAD family phosphatase [Rhizobium wuzhouense]PYB77145.1 2-haloalkanoic acid dehalogenase [Rhizobium wuzhouense]